MQRSLLTAFLGLSFLALPAADALAIPGYGVSSTGVLDNVLVAMNDAPGTGEKIVSWLRGAKVTVKFSDIPGNSLHLMLVDMGTGEKTPGIYINKKYSKDPISYRYLATLITK